MTGTLQILLPHRALEGILLPPVKEKLGPGPHGGDVKVMWDSDNETEVDLARAQFDAALKKGMAGFRVDKKGNKTEQIRRFDPAAEAIILAPALQGG